MTQWKTGLVLSGGAAKGYAHIGILQALYEAGIQFDVFAGASIGSIVGAFLAEGKSPAEIMAIFDAEKNFQLVKFKFSTTGLLKSDGLKKALEKHLQARTFEELPLPLKVAVTDLNTGKAHYFSEGPLLEAILASCAIPLLFAPIQLGGKQYVDGGLTDNLPASSLHGRCEQLYGININPIAPLQQINGFMETVERVLNIAIHNNVAKSIPLLNHYLEPQKMQDYHLFSLDKGQEMYALGYAYAKDWLSERQ